MVLASLHEVFAELLKRHPRAYSIAAAVDGSQIGDRAASVAGSFTNVKRGDKCSCLHVCDKSKAYLPRSLQPARLRNHYEALAASSRIQNTAWICTAKDKDHGTSQVLSRLTQQCSIDMLILGSFGRKGEKPLRMLGTVADHLRRESDASICIVQPSGRNVGKRATFLFATDGSHAAALAFCTLIKMIMRPSDTVDVVMVTTQATSARGIEKATIEQYQAFMMEHKVVGYAYVKEVAGMVTVAQAILEAVSDTEADILVLGASGLGKKNLGSTSEYVTTMAGCTTMMIRDTYDVLANCHSYHTAGVKHAEPNSHPPRAALPPIKSTHTHASSKSLLTKVVPALPALHTHRRSVHVL